MSESVMLFESVCSVASELISRGSGCGWWYVPGYTVLGDKIYLSLLGGFLDISLVPVCVDCVIIPNSGGLGVAEVTWLACIVRRVQKQWLDGESP